MKKAILCTVAAAAAVVFSAGAQAQSSVTLYGLVDAGIDVGRGGNGTLTRVISGGSFGSRLGFRGVEDLGGGMSAVFRLESGLNVDTGAFAQGGLAFGREASVGLSSRSLGTVQLGRLPTPYYSVQSVVDAFGWMGSGGLTAITRSGATTQQVLPLVIGARSDNALQYVSPKLGGFELRAQTGRKETSTTLGNSYGASLRYAAGPADVVFGYQRQNAAGSGNVTGIVLGGSYDFGVVRVHAGVTNEKNSCTTCTGGLVRATGVTGTAASEFRLINIGARMPFGATTLIVQAVKVQDRSSYAVATGDRDSTWLAIGGEYAFSKRTVAYGALGTIQNKNGSQYALGSGTVQQAAGFIAGDARSTTLSLGIRHVF
jgi:predicted porin